MVIIAALVRPNLMAITAALGDNICDKDVKEPTNGDTPKNNPQYTTVYFGNLAPEVTQLELHRHFHSFGAGVLRKCGCNVTKLLVLLDTCSWVSKPTPPGTTSNPLPPPVPAPILSPADLFAYERQLAMSKMALMHPQGQHPFKHANTNRAAVGASQAIYDGWFPECRCDVSLHGYVVSSLMDTAYWSSK
ncbi:nucleotide-binding alpha-beta plait domain-containing protein [Tanacetum coccineum]